jgi:hypothetical protein
MYLQRKTPPLIGIPDGRGKQVLEVLKLSTEENAAIDRDTRQRGGLGGTYALWRLSKTPFRGNDYETGKTRRKHALSSPVSCPTKVDQAYIRSKIFKKVGAFSI